MFLRGAQRSHTLRRCKLHTQYFYATYTAAERRATVIPSTNDLVATYAAKKDFERVVELWKDYKQTGTSPDNDTLLSFLHASLETKNAEVASSIFAHIAQNDVEIGGYTFKNLFVSMLPNTTQVEKLISYMANKGRIPNTFMYARLIRTYCQQDNLNKAMKTFAQLVDNNVELSDYIVKDLAQQYTTPSTRQHLYTIWNYILHTNAQLDISSYNALILACAKTRTLLGEKIYYYMLESSLKSNLKVENNLMLMYINCGKFETARRIFDQLEPDAISYNILLNGSISHGMDFASSLFRTMPQQLKSAHTYSTLLRGCAKWRNVTFAVELYDSMPKELLQEPRVANECITMFAKLMDIERAEQVFTQLENKTFVSWTSMLGAYRTCANGEKAVKLFYEMIANDYKPNNYAYGNVLTACSRAHMPEQAMKIYLEMKKYHYKPTIENNNIMVDVLARCENVDKAIEFAKTLEKTDVVTWTTILSACVKQNKIEQGIVAGEMAIEMDPLDPSAYTLYAGLLRAAGRYEEAQAIRDKITALGLSTKPGTSMIEYQGEQIMFYSRSENPFSEEIEQGSEEFLRKLEQHGYKPDVSIIHTRVPENEESKKVKLFQHSERSALIFLLGRTKDEKTPIKIFSTLQICGDCHTVFALASKVYDREIQITAREQAHVFKNGKCSCNNKW